ncbi:hypothetical protein O0I10_001234 [Lichtheimia ornata]|uniref:Alginate lyase domain-containing protein n=1 Tax=Lichtheimia ornata TaxID=688661 RepID=A0AAD7Y3F6_9FUNG|nr:uncharacterized protein O0I10_001234 [Lichtheimia ornata]KAJ8663057.1 hypothetical protein O0I10_001234 [Lichtheimia ornata]
MFFKNKSKWFLTILIVAATSSSSLFCKAQDDGSVSADDDDSMSLMSSDVTGWTYPAPKAHDPPESVSDGKLHFAMIDPEALRENKKHMHDYDRELQHALWFLKKKADRYVTNTTTFSVIEKSIAVPGNDSHDYMSLARYFWPNESQPNGMPYIRHDGRVNPEIEKVPDYQHFRNLVKHVQYLSLAYHFFDNETYAAKATQRIHDWFIDSKTRMNPHLQYASLVRGYNTGRAKGIIDFHVLPDLMDSMAILQYSKSWKEGMNRHIRYWFAQYIEWLIKSPNGIFEKESHNNHGTYYDVQRVAIYRFLGKKDLAQQVLQNATASRIAQQILSSGEMYQETARPFSWFYSIFNLKALFQLAHMGRQVGVDLHQYKTVDGKSIRSAVDFMLPYAANESTWNFYNSGGFDSSYILSNVLNWAYIAYANETYLAMARKLGVEHSHPYNITRLSLPWRALGDHSDRAMEGFQPASPPPPPSNDASSSFYYTTLVGWIAATLLGFIFTQ